MKNINNEKGFTLVELLVSMLIFAIGAAALTQTLIATMRGNNLGNKETTAMTLAYHELEELRGIDPGLFDGDLKLKAGVVIHVTANSTVSTTITTQNFAPSLLGGLTPVTQPAGYHISYVVTDINPGNGALFYQTAKQVTVTVRWADPTTHNITVSSVLTPNI